MSLLLIRWKLIINRIIILQKRALRIVSKSWYAPQTDPIFKEQKLLKCQDIHLFQLGLCMISFKNSTLPPSKFNNFFSMNNQIHNYNTRSAQSFRLLLSRTSARRFPFITFKVQSFRTLPNAKITKCSVLLPSYTRLVPQVLKRWNFIRTWCTIVSGIEWV